MDCIIVFFFKDAIMVCYNADKLCQDDILSELPRANDISNGFYRRFLIVPFNVQIPESRINPNLAQEIISNELTGIMNWVLEGKERPVKTVSLQILL